MCNTEQNYSGEGDSTTPTPETAQNAAQTPPTPDDWRDAFLLDVMSKSGRKEYLFKILDLVWRHVESTDPSIAIGQLYNTWVSSPFTEPKTLQGVSTTVVNHLVFMSEIRSAFECFDIETDFVDTLLNEGVVQ